MSKNDFNQIYDRIKNDPVFVESNFTIQYNNFNKSKTIPFNKWKKISDGGDIPEHKVISISYKDKVIWNKHKLCELEECKDIGVEYLGKELSILTYNTLSDVYEKRITDLTKRKDDIVKFIFETNADIICLQEVQPILLNTIKNIINNNNLNYEIFTSNMENNNLVILSKIKIYYSDKIYIDNYDVNTRETKIKQALAITIKLPNNTFLTIINIHLTSDFYEDKKTIRISQLFKIKKYLESKNINNTSIIITGDTNERDYNNCFNQYRDYIDTSFLTSKNNIPTYDTFTNKFAKQLSKTDTVYRFDRLLYKNNIYSSFLHCIEYNILDNIKWSDHYPIFNKFTISENSTDSNINNDIIDNQTALCIIPPYNVWNEFYKLGFKQKFWMPHIKLILDFTNEDNFDQMYNELKCIHDFYEFDIVYDSINYINKDNSVILFIQPDKESNVKLLQLYKIFSNYSKHKFNPYIILGKYENVDQIKSFISQPINIQFNINKINFVSKFNYEYYRVKKTIYFNKKINTNSFELLKSIFINLNITFQIGGSRLFYNDDNSDYDLLCYGNISHDLFFSQIKKIIETCGIKYNLVLVKNNYIYDLNLVFDDNKFDIQYCNLSDKNNIYNDSSTNVVDTSQYIVNFMNSLDKFELFVDCLKWVKINMKKLGLYGDLFCFTSGISLAIIVCYVIKNNNSDNIDNFILQFSNTDFNKPISLNKNNNFDETKPCDKYMYIESPTNFNNTMRHITRSTSFIIKNSFKNSFIIDLNTICNNTFYFTLKSEDEDECYECMKWFEKNIHKILIDIERISNDIILLPSNNWIKNNNNEFIWILKSNLHYSCFDYICKKYEKRSREIFVKSWLVFC